MTSLLVALWLRGWTMTRRDPGRAGWRGRFVQADVGPDAG
jgi:hypothetical protein